jgi:hypothetical protein
MRTTLELDDSVLAAARALARSEGISLGNAVSALARRGLAPTPPRPISTGGFPVFDVRAGADPITLELVNAHRDGD